MSDRLKLFLVATPLTLTIMSVSFLGYSGYTYSKVGDTTKEVLGEGEEVKVGVKYDIVDLYPNIPLDYTTLNVNSSFFEGLVRFDENFRVKPLLAEKWDTPDDNTWRFYLKKGVKFHSGEALKASDVKFTLDLIKDQAYPLADYISSIESVSVIDDSTVEIKTAAPYPLLLNRLTSLFILSEKSVKEKGIESPVGTGPYKFVEWVKEDHITVTAFDGYHGTKPKIKKVIFTPFSSDDQLVEKLEKGEINIAEINKKEDRKKFGDTNKFTTKMFDDYGVYFLMPNFREGKISGTNTDKNPYLDKKVRQAIYYSLDIDKVIAARDLSSSPAQQMTTPSVFGYSADIKRYPHDLEKSRSLMKEAGFEKGFETTILTGSDKDKSMEELKRQLLAIGITLKVEIEDSNDAFFEKVGGGEFSLIDIDWTNDSGDSSDFIDSVAKTGASSNISGYSNEKIDSLSEKISSSTDQGERKELLGEAYKLINDEAAFIPLTTSKRAHIYNRKYSLLERVDGLIKAENVSEKKSEIVKKPTFTNYVLAKIGF